MERVDQGYLKELVHEGLPREGEVKVPTVEVTWEDIHQNVDLIGKGDRDLDMKVTFQLLQVCHIINFTVTWLLNKTGILPSSYSSFCYVYGVNNSTIYQQQKNEQLK